MEEYNKEACGIKHTAIEEALTTNKTDHEKLHSRISSFILALFLSSLAAIGGLVLLVIGLLQKGGK